MVNYVLSATLIVSVFTDLRFRKIFNWITFPAILFGIIYHSINGGWSGFLSSGLGFLAGLSLLLIPFLMGGMGAGDVKLAAAVGCLMGSSFVITSILYAGCIGGVMAIAVLLWRNQLKQTAMRIFHVFLTLQKPTDALETFDRKELHKALPYGVAIAGGVVCAILWGRLW